MSEYVLDLSKASVVDDQRIGILAATLASFKQNQIPILPGFVIISDAFKLFFATNNLDDKLKELVTQTNFTDSEEVNNTVRRIHSLIDKTDLDHALCIQIAKLHNRLIGSNPLTVTLSLKESSLKESFLDKLKRQPLRTQGDANLFLAIKHILKSLFASDALTKRVFKDHQPVIPHVALVVQQLPKITVSGVIYTADPSGQDKHLMIVEAVWGLPDKLLAGDLVPDHYHLEKPLFLVRHKEVSDQHRLLQFNKGQLQEASVAKKLVSNQKLPDDLIAKLAKLGHRLHQHHFFPQYAIFYVYKNQIAIIDSYSLDEKTPAFKFNSGVIRNTNPITVGRSASPGIVTGQVRVINKIKDLHKLKTGEILVTTAISPKNLIEIKKAAGLITEQGGVTSHTAIISREFALPAVVDCYQATGLLKTGQVITLDATTGSIYQEVKHQLPKPYQPKAQASTFVSATKVFTFSTSREALITQAKTNCAGAWLDYALLSNKHPQQVVKSRQQRQAFMEDSCQYLKLLTRAYGFRPIIYRLNQLTSSQMKRLTDGNHYEDNEENPLLGLFGASRLLSDHKLLELELTTLASFKSKHAINLILVLPMVRTSAEVFQLKKLITSAGLIRTSNLKLWLEVATPNIVLELEQTEEAKYDGILINHERLRTYGLAIDPENVQLDQSYSHHNLGHSKLVDQALSFAKAKKLDSCLLVQRAEMSSQIISQAVTRGCKSICLSGGQLNLARQICSEAEKSLTKNLGTH